MSNQSADVIIIGGGPIGCLAALELASHNISSIILDQTPQEMIANPLLEGRTIALSYASVALLEKLNLFHTLKQKAAPIE
ncbi:MAG: FAD-binding protein, partial [Caedimonadaceae bacterium]